MKVLVIGAGNMGSGFVKQLSAAGHQVSVTARNMAKAQAVAQPYGAKAVPAAGSADAVDAVVLATGYEQAVDALRGVGKVQGKPVIDITNPLTADYMGLTVGHSTSAAEQIAQAVPGVELVKGFNTLFAQVLAAGSTLNGQKVTVFLASDGERAKQTARTLAESMGFAVVDAGGLKNARYLEPLAGLNIYLGYGAGLGTGIAPTWIGKN
ncbi:NADPH-dependent F420 reductase [Castellaniella denitrificans]|uniref:NAD(P)-binding domain-containing protein n=1 Tax=Castellaniella denitrificans TaxID=56119 RepID=A0ABT4M0X2_9BURK|nr:NAD(P)-binding domain-containing protein [Castellaniella denitrificans]MCZ4328967.1 NAD(P)-binding domain-containing protein [Castellaniella denitrificans]